MATEVRDSYKTQQRKVLARVLKFIIQRRMTAPALFVLESTKPLSFLAAQSLIVFEPIIRTILPLSDYEVLTAAIEDRENIEWMIQQLEAVEEKQAQRRRTAKQRNDEY